MDTPPLLYKSVHVTFVFWVPKTPPPHPIHVWHFCVSPPPPPPRCESLAAPWDNCSTKDIAMYQDCQLLTLAIFLLDLHSHYDHQMTGHMDTFSMFLTGLSLLSE